MKTLKKLVVAAGFLTALFYFTSFRSLLAQTNEEIEKELAQIAEALRLLEIAEKPLKEELAQLRVKLTDIERRINNVSLSIDRLEENIKERSQDLDYQKMLFNQRVRNQYIKQRSSSSPLLLFLSTDEALDLTQEVWANRIVARRDQEELIEIAQNLLALQKDKEFLEKEKVNLAAVKKTFASRAQFLEGEIKGAEEYRAQLSAKQKELLTARSGSFTSAVGEVPVSNIPCSGPPGSPSFCNPGGGNWFAAFSFGAWTHRKGMSQYGAKGRAEVGQSHQEILKAYYGKEPVDKDTNGDILVDGYGSLNFEEYYLMGIAEMPSSWHKEALKAQAIAARTYAYRYKQGGQTICTTQACQVFSKSKADNPPPAWREAVVETKGKIIEDVITYYSSTAGGYLTTSGWDTTDGKGGEGFASRAWESKAGSPWFYSSWYTEGFTAATGTCGRSHPWLTEIEMADILNAWLVLKNHRDDPRVLPVTINQCPIEGITGNPYSLEEMKNKANENGGAYTNVFSVSVRYGNDGKTSSATFQTNKGEISIPGSEFLEAFNLRAPGFVAIRSPLFNVEKK